MNPHVDVDVLPVIYRQNFLNQSAPIPPTTIVVPSVDSHYRASFIMNGRLSNALGFVTWTDDDGMENFSFSAPTNSSIPDEPGQTAVIKVLAGQSFSFQVISSTPTPGPYSLFVVAESLD